MEISVEPWFCPDRNSECDYDCKKCVLDWLNEPYQDEEEANDG